LLETTHLFRCFCANEIDALFANDQYKIKKYTKSSVVYLQNERCKSLDIILEGEVFVQKIDSEGNTLTIYNFVSGDVIGENLLFSNRNNYPMTIIAKYNSTILHVKKELVLRLCQENIEFLNNFLQSISDKTLILTDRINALTLKSIRQSIAEFLIQEYNLQKNLKIKLSMTKKELAEKMGIQRPSLSRELNKMRRDGLITFDSKYITINNIEQLSKIHVESL
jgi:CRP-like cAMP-binding protein